MHALIDCGALLAGTDLLDFSKRILVFLPMDEFGGVLFFDGARSHEWIILERTGRLLQKDISPVKESKTFAIFDEPRCRGTDLKLRSDAIALWRNLIIILIDSPHALVPFLHQRTFKWVERHSPPPIRFCVCKMNGLINIRVIFIEVLKKIVVFYCSKKRSCFWGQDASFSR